MMARQVIRKKTARRPKKRLYQSPARERQADETRSRIASAARQLLVQSGYTGMTIAAVARAAGVAVPTVYAIFGSKKGIVAELLDEARFGETFQNLVREARQTVDPRKRLAFASRIPRQVYEAELPVEKLLRGAGMLAPELANVESERECERYESQAHLIDGLQQAKLLRMGLDRETARDILWSLTSRDFFRLLVSERRWTLDQYERWLKATLERELIGG
jgi:TetR/AcrR family transcriptional regulator, regulator of cefoperazone and chloramphenicol sensitivity